ncbi:hypothetical protein PIB30_029360 [Stylosanthes scabra]|uniref:Uncharacterized protein n=1 Tax=Stylosanthes scabra TaxID=79078 RepID=A0ABU6SAT7_9FABA|nr:hypothetical protein [Stylosanthes scabra]
MHPLGFGSDLEGRSSEFKGWEVLEELLIADWVFHWITIKHKLCGNEPTVPGSTHIWSRCCLEFVTQPPAPKSNPLSPVQSCCHQDLLRVSEIWSL